MSQSEAKTAVAVKRGVYQIPVADVEGHLIGSKCKACGSHFYPQRNNCLVCYSEDLEEVALSKRGKIWTYTIGRQTYPGVLLTPPFISARVKLPEEVFIQTLVTDVDFQDVKIGMEVESYFFTVKADEERNVIAFAFRPVSQ